MLDTPYVVLRTRDSIRRVQCMFSEKTASQLYNLRPGQEVAIEGTVSGLMMNVIVRDCTVVP